MNLNMNTPHQQQQQLPPHHAHNQHNGMPGGGGPMNSNDPRTPSYSPYHPHHHPPPPYLMHMYTYPQNGHMMSPVRPGAVPNGGGGVMPGHTHGHGHGYPHDMRMMGGMPPMMGGPGMHHGHGYHHPGSLMNQGSGGNGNGGNNNNNGNNGGSNGENKHDLGLGVNGGQGGQMNGHMNNGNDLTMGGSMPPRGHNVHRCQRIMPPITLKVWSEEEMKNSEIPDFPHLVNFPAHLHRYRTLSEVEKDRRRCVMCGETRLCSSSNSNQSRETFSRSKQKMANNSRGLQPDEPNDTVHIIPKQNKGLCTACDVAVWVIKENGVEIKWCKGCKNFRPWAAFGDKGLATKCLRCRERQREKYATQKEEKYKKNAPAKATATVVAAEKKEKEVVAVKKSSSTDADADRTKKSSDSATTGTKTPKFSSPHNHGMSCLIAATTQVTSGE